jgi:predicted nucleic acid-binding protein
LSIQQFFDSDAISMLPYTTQAVRLFAELRANHGVKALDALHLSISAAEGVDLFLTHDRRLHKLIVPGLPFIAGLETDLF